MFIAIEGIEDTGKTTIATLLAAHFGFNYFKVESPVFTATMENLTHQPDQNVSYMADIANLKHTSNLVESAILSGKPAVSDSYTATARAYHLAQAKLDNMKEVFDPDLKTFAICETDVAFHLMGKQPENELEKRALANLLTMPLVEIDVSNLSPEQVAQEIMHYLELYHGYKNQP